MNRVRFALAVTLLASTSWFLQSRKAELVPRLRHHKPNCAESSFTSWEMTPAPFRQPS